MNRFFKILLRFFAALLVLTIALLLLLNLPATQQYLSGKLEHYLEGKLKTEVEIGGIRVQPFKSLLIEKVYLEDEQKDTLFYVKEILVDFDLADLFQQKVRFQNIGITDLKGNLTIDENGAGNFDFISQAFAGPTEPKAVLESPDTTTTNSWEFIFGQADLDLKNIDFYYQDRSTSTLYDVKFQELRSKVKEIDLNNSLFDMEQIELQHAAIVINIPPSDTTDTSPANPVHLNIKLQDANLEKVDLNLDIRGMLIGFKQADLVIENGDFEMHDTSIVILAPILNLTTNQFDYHIGNSPELPGFDAKNLVWQNVHIEADSFQYNNLDISANIHQLHLEDPKGLTIEEARAQFEFTPTTLDLKNLHLKTVGSDITDEQIQLRYNFLEGQPLEDLYLNLTTTRANLALKDILYFQPTLANMDFFKTYKDQNITVRTRLDGTFRDLKIPELDLQLWEGTRLQGSGRAFNVLDTKKLKGLLKVNVLQTTGKNLQKWLPKGVLPSYVQLPKQLIAQGLIQGDLKNLDVDLDIKTSRPDETMASRLRTKAKIKNVWPIEGAYFDIKIDTFLTTRNDLLSYLPPNILPEYITLPNILALQGTAKGTLKDMQSDLRLSAIRNNSDSYLVTSGSFKELLDPNNLSFNIEINSLNLDPDEIMAYLPANTLPAYILMPFIRNAKGALKGNFKDLDGNISIKSSSGELKLKGQLKGDEYDLNVVVKDLILKKLFDEQAYDTLSGGVELPPLSGTLNIKGHGLDPQNDLKARISMQVQPTINGQLRKGVSLAGDITEQSFKGVMSSEEKEVSFTAYTMMDFNDVIPLVEIQLDLRKLDFYKMGLSKKEFYINGALDGTLKGNSLDTLDVDFLIDDFEIVFDSLSQKVDSIEVTASLDNGANNITISSEVMYAFLKGQFEFTEIAAQLEQQMYGYFNIETADTLIGGLDDNFQFYIEVFRPDILTMGIIPELTELSPFFANGSYKGWAKDLRLYGEIPSVTYMDVAIDSIGMVLRTDQEKFNYKFEVNEINLFDQVRIYRMIALGDLQDKKLDTQLKFLDTAGKSRFDLKSSLTSEYESLRLQLKPEQLINYQTWHIPAQNAILINKDRINVLGWKLTNNGSFIQIANRGLNSMDILFENFDLGLVADILEHQSQLVGGQLNGRLTLSDVLTAPIFDTDLTINNWQVIKAKLGDLSVKVNNQKEIDTYHLDLNLLGEGNHIGLLGDYRSKDKFFPLQLKTDIKALNLATLEPFIDTYLSEMEGIAQGKINIEGSLLAPELLGELTLKNAAFNVKMFNARLRLGEEKIIFDANAIEFDQLTLTDNLGGTGTVSAYILTPNFIDYNLDLKVKTNNFLVLDTKKGDNPLYYGKMFVNANARIIGDLALPIIEADVSPTVGSSLTYLFPSGLQNVDTGEGVVEFITPEEERRRDEEKIDENPAIYQASGGFGFKVIANIDVNENLDFKAILNPISGDNFEGKAKGDLTFTLFETGKMELIGSAELQEGNYLFTYYDVIQRNFKVAQGSRITWTGDPFNPDLAINVHYKIKTAPYALVTAQESELTESQIAALRNNYDFTTELQIGGTLNKTEIRTNIIDDHKNNDLITAALDNLRLDESRMNTQAFGLILFNGFVGQDLNSTSAKVVDIQGSLSNLISQQLNGLANRYIKFVELDFGVDNYTDGNSNNITDFRVSVKKRFFKDRLIVNIDGVASTANNQNDTDRKSYLNNLTVEYLLTKDGVLKMSLYNKRTQDDFLGENALKFGAALVISKDFNEIKLFKN